jgi:hypothetical protein
MAQFALLYNDIDLAEVQKAFNEARINNVMTQQQRRRARDYWEAGLSGWATAPLTHEPQYNCEPEGCRVVVVNLANGDKADFVGLLNEIVQRLPLQFIEFFAGVVDDCKSSGCVEPWPPA